VNTAYVTVPFAGTFKVAVEFEGDLTRDEMIDRAIELVNDTSFSMTLPGHDRTDADNAVEPDTWEAMRDLVRGNIALVTLHATVDSIEEEDES
jgi:hypothetical protein